MGFTTLTCVMAAARKDSVSTEVVFGLAGRLRRGVICVP